MTDPAGHDSFAALMGRLEKNAEYFARVLRRDYGVSRVLNSRLVDDPPAKVGDLVAVGSAVSGPVCGRYQLARVTAVVSGKKLSHYVFEDVGEMVEIGREA